MLLVNIPSGKSFSTPLGRVTKAASARSPIEECVLLDANADGLTLTTVDAHTHQLCLRVPEADAIDHGQVLIKAGMLKDLIGDMDTGTMHLNFSDDEKKLIVRGESNLELFVYNEPPEAFPMERTLPPVVGVVDANNFQKAITAAVALLEEGEFVTLVARGDQLLLYTRSRGSMYSRAAIELRESPGDWEISIPMNLWGHLPPKMSGLAELRLHEDFDNFAVSIGTEYLLLKQVVNDMIAGEVEDWVSKPSTDYVTLKSDAVLRDLSRASRFKGNKGLSMDLDGDVVTTRCESSGVGKAETPLETVNVGGDFSPMAVDPATLAQAVKTLSAVDVVFEQLKETIEGFDGEDPTENIWLRVRDADNPDRRVIVVSTLV